MGLSWGNLKVRDHLEDLGVVEDSINMDVKVIGWEDVDWIWLHVGTSVVLLQTRQ
jgi:hypothetical protein